MAKASKTRPSAIAPALPRLLLWGVRGCLALVLLTPLVLPSHLYSPFIAGKALYSRTLIEAMACLWAVLVLLDRSWRPPRSKLLVVLAAGLGCHLLATWAGVSPLRSFWSTYARMEGFVGVAHWFVFIVVLASVARDSASVRAFLNIHLGVALMVGCLAIAGYFTGDVPLYNTDERDAPRIGSVLGNANYLGAYAAVNVVLALGFLARGFTSPVTQSGPATNKRTAPSQAWLRAFWISVAATNLAAVVVSGSYTSYAALVGGIGFLFAVATFAIRRPVVRTIAIAGFALMGAGAAAMTVTFAMPNALSNLSASDSSLLQRVGDANIDHPSFVKRRIAWQAGIQGFLERPWLGWGPENFVVIFGRFATGIGPDTEVHDYAHNKTIEEAATKGLGGLICYVALWVLTFRAILRARRRQGVFALFVGAALATYFLQSQTLFDTVALNLQFMLLIAFVIAAAPTARRSTRLRTVVAKVAALANRKARRVFGIGARIAFGGAIFGLAAAGLASNYAIHSATTSLVGTGAVKATRDHPIAHIEHGMRAFEPMANSARLLLFHEITQVWTVLRVRRGAEASRLLALAKTEGERATATEPRNWQIQAALAKLYDAARYTDRDYGTLADEARNRALALAPRLDTFLPHIYRWNLNPLDVFGNSDCLLTAGDGPVTAHALIAIATDYGAAFAVLDPAGTYLSGRLDFRPNHLQFGKPKHRHAVVALGALRWKPGYFAPPDGSTPVRVFDDGHLIYQTQRALDFGLDPSGKLLYVHEPLPDGRTRMVVRELGSGARRHYELGEQFAPNEAGERRFTAGYSIDADEVMLTLLHPARRGERLFLGTRDSRRREVLVFDHDKAAIKHPAPLTVRNARSAVFASSNTGYFAHPHTPSATDAEPGWLLVRRDFDHQAGTVSEAWTLPLSRLDFDGRMTLSSNGKWLAFGGENIRAVNTLTGEIVFTYATGDPRQELQRLENVMPQGSTAADLGRVSGWQFHNNTIGVHRIIGADALAACDRRIGRKRYHECLSKLRRDGRYRTVADVFGRLDRGQPGRRPYYRAEINAESPCDGAYFDRRLQSKRGILIFSL